MRHKIVSDSLTNNLYYNMEVCQSHLGSNLSIREQRHSSHEHRTSAKQPTPASTGHPHRAVEAEIRV